MAPKDDIISSIRESLPKELGGGKKDKENLLLQIASFIDSIERKSPPVQIGVGGSVGLCTGYIFTKGSKATALVLGVGLVAFQFCNYRGYIKLNRSQIEKQAQDLRDLKEGIKRELSGKSKFDVDKAKVGSFVTSHAYLLSGFAAGALLGYAVA